VPTLIGDDRDWYALAAGDTHSVGLKKDGRLFAWGENVRGQLANFTTADYNMPRPVGLGPRKRRRFLADSGWAAATAGKWHTIGLRDDGRLFAWGANDKGQLGCPTKKDSYADQDRYSPVAVGGGTNWAAVAAGGRHTLAIKRDATLWAWGANNVGQLGTDSATQPGVPVQVGEESGWVAVAAGFLHSIAMRSDGSLWGWGEGRSGQIGPFAMSEESAPTLIEEGPTGSVVSAGDSCTVVLQADGTVSVWGQWQGRLGTVLDGDSAPSGDMQFEEE